MAAELMEIGILLAKAESTYGTDPVPTLAANALPTVDKLALEFLTSYEDRRVMAGLGPIKVAGYTTMKYARASFTYHLRGNRTDGSTPDISAGSSANAIEIDCLLKAAGLDPTYTAESGGGARDGKVIYIHKTFSGGGDKSVTLYWYTDQSLHKLTGGTVDFELIFDADKMVAIKFTVSGFYTRPADNTFSTTNLAFLATTPPQFSAATITISAFAPIIKTASLKLGNDVQLLPDATAANGVGKFKIVDYNPTLTLDPQKDTAANFSVFADWEAGVTKSFGIALGAQTGNKFQAFGNMCPRNVAYGERNKIRTMQLDYDLVLTSFVPGTGFATQLGLQWY